MGYRALAALYVGQKNIDAALKTIRDGLKQQPDDIALHTTLAGLLEQAENYEGAISEYENVLSRQPGSMVATNNLASLLADHRTDKVSLQRAVSLAAGLRQSPVPQFVDTLGWLSYRQGDFKTAVQLLERQQPRCPMWHRFTTISA